MEVDIAASASEARVAMAHRDYDAIVSDYQMPGEDGIQFLRSLRASGDSTPFILFTGKGREEVVIEAFDCGADAYLQKGGEPRSLFAELEHRIVTSVRRHRAEEALQDSESEFRSLFDDNPDAVSLVDIKGKVLNCNAAAARMVLLGKDEIIGGGITDMGVFEKSDLALFQQSVLAMMKGIPTLPIVASVHRRDGTTKWVELRASLVKKGGQFHATQIIARDITERKQVEEALRLANRKLSLLSSITRHDIDNQMTLLKGNLALVERDQTDLAAIDRLQKAAAAAERITAMIQFTSIYEDIGTNAPMWQDIRSLVTKCDAEVHMGKVRLENDVPVSLEVFADPLIRKVFYNLIDNAIRYGDTISALHFYVEDRDGTSTIVCEDDGRGVSLEIKETLFSRGCGKGHGLGLFLSREILSITGIGMDETGEPGRGARFVLTVPKGAIRTNCGPGTDH